MKTMVQNEILKLAVEDYYGLWELFWAIRENYPNYSADEFLEIAQEATKYLLSSGSIILYSRQGADGTEVQMQELDAEEAISNPQNWREPSRNTIQILVGSTAYGEKVYYSKGKNLKR